MTIALVSFVSGSLLLSAAPARAELDEAACKALYDKIMKEEKKLDDAYDGVAKDFEDIAKWEKERNDANDDGDFAKAHELGGRIAVKMAKTAIKKYTKTAKKYLALTEEYTKENCAEKTNLK